VVVSHWNGYGHAAIWKLAGRSPVDLVLKINVLGMKARVGIAKRARRYQVLSDPVMRFLRKDTEILTE
jgi:hypothetical protein